MAANERERCGMRGGQQGRYLVRPSSQLDLILPLSDGPRQQVPCSGGLRARQRAPQSPSVDGRVREKAGAQLAHAPDDGAALHAALRRPAPRTPCGCWTAAAPRGGTLWHALASPAWGPRPRWRQTRAASSPKMKGVYSEKELMSPRAIAGPKIKAMRHHDIPMSPHPQPLEPDRRGSSRGRSRASCRGNSFVTGNLTWTRGLWLRSSRSATCCGAGPTGSRR